MKPPPPSLIPQQAAVLERLDQALSHRLGLLVAPAGWGKSALLQRWAEGCGVAVARLSLVEEDNQAERFLADLKGVLWGAAPQPQGDIIELVNALAEKPGELALALDEYHLIWAEEVHERVGLLLDYLPPRVHVLIACRAEPPLPIPRMRVRRQVVEIVL